MSTGTGTPNEGVKMPKAGASGFLGKMKKKTTGTASFGNDGRFTSPPPGKTGYPAGKKVAGADSAKHGGPSGGGSVVNTGTGATTEGP